MMSFVQSSVEFERRCEFSTLLDGCMKIKKSLTVSIGVRASSLGIWTGNFAELVTYGHPNKTQRLDDISDFLNIFFNALKIQSELKHLFCVCYWFLKLFTRVTQLKHYLCMFAADVYLFCCRTSCCGDQCCCWLCVWDKKNSCCLHISLVQLACQQHPLTIFLFLSNSPTWWIRKKCQDWMLLKGFFGYVASFIHVRSASLCDITAPVDWAWNTNLLPCDDQSWSSLLWQKFVMNQTQSMQKLKRMLF